MGDQTNLVELRERAREMEGAMGAIAFAVLEMFRQGGMPESEVKALHEQMKHYFMVPSNNTCNDICRLLEERLQQDKESAGVWYHTPGAAEKTV